MVYEMLINEVAPERREDYIKTWKETWAKADRPGCHGVKMLRCIEHPGRVITQIAWDSVEAHEAARDVPNHGLIREVRGQFDAKGEGFAHYTIEEF